MSEKGDTSATHRCADCAQQIEHTPAQLCPACGRCAVHCHRNILAGCLVGAGESESAALSAITKYWKGAR